MTVSFTIPVVPAIPNQSKGGFIGTPDEYASLWAFAEALGWMDRPFDFVLNSWLASRS